MRRVRFTNLTMAGFVRNWFVVGARLAATPLAAAPATLLADTANPASNVRATQPATNPAATQAVAPMDAAHLQFTGLLGDLRFRHVTSIMQIALTPDGKQVASAGWNDDAVHFWDLATGKEVRRLGSKDGGDVGKFVVWPDGKRLAVASNAVATGKVTLWNLETGQFVRTLEQANVRSLAVAPDGQTLFTGDAGGKIVQWNVETGLQIQEFQGDPWLIDGLLLSFNGKRLLGIYEGTSAALWKVTSGQSVWSTPGGDGSHVAGAFRPRNDQLAISNPEDHVRLIATDNPSTDLWTTALPKPAVAMAFSPDGQVLAVSCRGSKIHLLSGQDGKELRTLALSGAFAQALAFNGKGDILFGSDGNTICQWDVATGRRLFPAVVASEEPALTALEHMAISPDGQFLYAAAEDSQNNDVWGLLRKARTWGMPIAAAVVMAGIAGLASAAPITIETVPVGDVGNAADTHWTGNHHRAVAYAYNIGKYEVTAGQYTAFLNAVVGVDANGLYDTRMWTQSDSCTLVNIGRNRMMSAFPGLGPWIDPPNTNRKAAQPQRPCPPTSVRATGLSSIQPMLPGQAFDLRPWKISYQYTS